MRPDSLVTTLLGILSSSGFLGTVFTIIGVVVKARSGQKIREPARRQQIAADAGNREQVALERAAAAEAAYDSERTLRLRWQDVAHEVRRVCIDHGTPLSALPPFPDDPTPNGATP